MDEAGENIKEDAFFYPELRRCYSFREFSDDVRNNRITVNTTDVVCWVGIGYIYKWTRNEIMMQLQHLLESLSDSQRNSNIKLWVSTLLPMLLQMHKIGGALLMFNNRLQQVVDSWKKMGCSIQLISSHKLFIRKDTWLDEATALMVDNYNLKQKAEALFDERGIHLTVPRWFHLQQLWLRELGFLPQFPMTWELVESDSESITESELDSGYNSPKHQKLDDTDANLMQHTSLWKSPWTVLDAEDE